MNIFKKLTLACGMIAIVGAPVSTALGAKVPNPDFSVLGASLLTTGIVTVGCIGLTKMTELATRPAAEFTGKAIDKKEDPAAHKMSTGLLVTVCGVIAIQMARTIQHRFGFQNSWKNNLVSWGFAPYMWEHQTTDDGKDPKPTEPKPEEPKKDCCDDHQAEGK